MKIVTTIVMLASALMISAPVFGQLHTSIQPIRGQGTRPEHPASRSAATQSTAFKATQEIVPLAVKADFSVELPMSSIQFVGDDLTDHTIDGTVTNLTDSTIKINFHRIQHMAAGWTSSVCFGTLCLSSSSDSGRDPFKFAAHEKQAFILHMIDTTDTTGLTEDQKAPAYARWSHNDSNLVTIFIYHTTGSANDTAILHLSAYIAASHVGVAAQPAAATLPSIEIFPNPIGSSGEVHLQLTSLSTTRVSLSVVDMRGAVVRAPSTLELSEGVTAAHLTLGDLPNGSYQLVGTTPAGMQISKRFEVVR